MFICSIDIFRSGKVNIYFGNVKSMAQNTHSINIQTNSVSNNFSKNFNSRKLQLQTRFDNFLLKSAALESIMELVLTTVPLLETNVCFINIFVK